MIRQDRELLAELARVNSDVAPLAMRIMEGSATAAEQHELAGRLIDVGRWLCQRAEAFERGVVDGEVVEPPPARTNGHDDTVDHQEP
jgi:hypothetical protein